MVKDKGGLRADLKRAQLVVKMAERNLNQAPSDGDTVYWQNFLAEARAEVARLKRELG